MSETLASINLAEPADLRLVCSSVSRGWPLAPSVREEISKQIVPALNSYAAQGDHTNVTRALKLAEQALAKSAADLIAAGCDEGVFQTTSRRVRARNPDRRRLRRLGRERAREALHARVLQQQELQKG